MGSVSMAQESLTLRRVTQSIGKNLFTVKKPQGTFLSNYPIIEINHLCITGYIRWLSNNNQILRPAHTTSNESWLRLFVDQWTNQQNGMLEKIDGEFAVIIWDYTIQEIWAIRDIFGTEPLHYFSEKQDLTFASNAKSLWPIPNPPPKLNKERVLDFIVDDLEHADQTSTFKQGIYKTPIGSIVHWKNGNVQNKQYWNPKIPGVIEQTSAEVVLEQFQLRLSKAIDKRLSPNQPDGLTLSGGLDSNIILSCWNQSHRKERKLNRHLFSLIPEKKHRFDPESMMLMNQKNTHENLHHHWITPSKALENIGPAEEFVRQLEDPFAIHSLSGPAPCFRYASNIGVQQILDGVDGDMVAGIPSKYWYFLWKQGQHISSIKECLANHHHEGDSIVLALTEISKLFIGSMFPCLKTWYQGRKSPDQSIRKEVKNLVKELSLITNTFSQDHIADRLILLKSNHHPVTPTTIEQCIVNGLKSPMLGVAVDRYRLAADACNIRTIHPLFDRSMVEFLLQLPWNYRATKGAPKHLFRMALRNFGHDQLANQKELGHVGPWFTQQFSRDYITRHHKLKSESLDSLSQYVDVNQIQNAWLASKQVSSCNGLDEYLWRLIMLSEWLIVND